MHSHSCGSQPPLDKNQTFQIPKCILNQFDEVKIQVILYSSNGQDSLTVRMCTFPDNKEFGSTKYVGT